jgi:hypothetical protein
MSNLIGFLETLGSNAAFRNIEAGALEKLMTEEGLAPHARAALLSADRKELEILLDAQAEMCCLVHAPDFDDQEADKGG